MGTVYYRNIRKEYDENNNLISRDCSKCGRHLERENFPKTKSSSYVDGIKGKCNECVFKYFVDYEAKNRDRLKDYRQEYYLENQGKINDQNKLYAQNNKEQLSQYNKSWRQENDERLRSYYKQWTKENKDSVNEYKSIFNSNKRAMIKKLPYSLTREDWVSIKDIFNHRCTLTNSENITIEHFIPLSVGHGGTIHQNCYPMDAALNYSKNSRNPFEWSQEQINKGSFTKEKWESLVSYLAKINNMSTTEYEEYVKWCFKNKRSVDDITEEVFSVELWLGSR